MVNLNETERAVMREIKVSQRRYFNSPAVDELAKVLGMTEQMAMYYLEKLSEKGYVELVRPYGERLVIVPLYWE